VFDIVTLATKVALIWMRTWSFGQFLFRDETGMCEGMYE
jgi:hypothetical protein